MHASAAVQGRVVPALGFCLVLALAYWAFLVVRSPLLLADYAWWLIEAKRIDDILLGRDCAEAFRLKPYPVPNALTQAALAALKPAVGWRAAAALWLALDFGLLLASVRHLARVVGAGAVPVLFAVVSIGLGANFWEGHLNYSLSVSLWLYAAALFLDDALTARRFLVLSLVAFFCHAIGFAFIAGLYGLTLRRGLVLRQLAAALPAAILTAWYVIGRFVLLHDAEAVRDLANPPWGTAAFALFKADTFLKLGGFSNFFATEHGSRHYVGQEVMGWGFPVIGLLLAAVVAVVLLRLWAGAVAASLVRRGGEARRAVLLLYCTAWAAVALLVPPHLMGIVELGFRLLAMAAAVVVFLLDWSGRGGRLVAGCLVALATLDLVFLARLGPLAAYADRPAPVLLGGFADHLLLDFSHARLNVAALRIADRLDAERCDATRGRFTGLVLPRR